MAVNVGHKLELETARPTVTIESELDVFKIIFLVLT